MDEKKNRETGREAWGALSAVFADTVRDTSEYVVSIEGRGRFPSAGLIWNDRAIVTAAHALRRDEGIPVVLPDGSVATAELAGFDRGTDLAVLRYDAGTATGSGAASAAESNGAPAAESSAVQAAESSAKASAAPTGIFTARQPAGTAVGLPRPGEVILAVGRTRTTGVSAFLGIINRSAGPWRSWKGGAIDSLLRLDLNPYPGLSGSAVVNSRGELLGMATTGLARYGVIAVPRTTIERVTEHLLSRGHVPRPYIGLAFQPVALPAELAALLDPGSEVGMVVLTVEPKGPSHTAGVRLGDVLVALQGKPVEDIEDVQKLLEAVGIGQPVTAVLLRGGNRIEVPIIVGERPSRRG